MILFRALVIAIIFSYSSLAFGQSQPNARIRVPLNAGMTLSEVQALWGPPDEVLENDISKKIVWHYAAYRSLAATRLVFQKGMLLPDDSRNQKAESRPSHGKKYEADLSTRSVKSQEQPQSFMALSDHKILEEILNEVPSGPEANESSPARGGAATTGQVVE